MSNIGLTSLRAPLVRGSIQLDSALLGADFSSQVIKAFSGSVVQFVNTSITSETDQYIQFTGTSPDLLGVFDQAVTGVFFYHQDQVHLLIKVALSDAWDFSWGYPELPYYTHHGMLEDGNQPSFFSSLKFVDGLEVLFSSHDYQEDATPSGYLEQLGVHISIDRVHQGLNYCGVLDLGNTLLDDSGLLDTLLNYIGGYTDTSLLITGYLKHEDSYDQIYLAADLPFTKTYEDVFTFGITQLILHTNTSVYDLYTGAGISFLGAATIGSGTTNVDTIEITWPVGSDRLLIQNYQPIAFTDLETTFSSLLAGYLPSDSDSFPIATMESDFWDSLEIRELVLELTLSTVSVSALGLSIGPDSSWRQALLGTDGEALSMEDILLQWDVVPGADEPIRFNASASFLVGGGLVNVSALFPDMVFSGELGLNQTISLKKIVPEAPFELAVLDLAASADLANRLYEFEIEMASDFEFDLGGVRVLPMKDLMLRWENNADTTFGAIQSILSIGGVDVILLATYIGGDWAFSGSTQPYASIPVGEFIAHIGSIPKPLESLYLYYLAVSFNLPNTEFRFEARAAFEVNDQEADLSLVITLENETGGYQKDFTGVLEMGNGMTFTVAFSSDPTSSVLSASYNATGDEPFTTGGILEAFGLSTDDLPAPLEDLAIAALDFTYATDTGDFTFAGEVAFEIGSTAANLLLDISVTRQAGGAYTKTFGGTLTLSNGMAFTLAFSQDATDAVFVGTYENLDGSSLSLKTFSDALPDVSITIRHALFALQKETSGNKYLFGLELGNGIDLAHLPLVGAQLAGMARIAYQLGWASDAFDAAEAGAINALLPGTVPSLKSDGVAKGFSIATQLMLDDVQLNFDLPLNANDDATDTDTLLTDTDGDVVPPADAATATSSTTASTHWIDIKKKFGAVQFNRLGVQLTDGELWFYLDMVITSGPLTLALDGLGAGSSVTAFAPKFALSGLGIDYKKGTVELGGHFIRQLVTADDGHTFDEYVGRAVLKMKKLAIDAIGAYSNDHYPSLFIYAFLNKNLGGPIYFQVQGLALGFGFNRALQLPTVATLRQHPFIQEALGAVAPGAGVREELARIDQYIRVEAGEYFVAIGVKFTSFKVLNSFALLTLSLGEHFEIDVLGTSSLRIPRDITNTGTASTQNKMVLVNVDLNLVGRFAPDEGFLGVKAVLDKNTSYVLSPDCHLQGGFAFYSWFSGEHEGDFVVTLGGYHPRFAVPDHYPQVPRLGFSWQVDSHTSLKGDMYYTLTPHAYMVGGHLEADYRNGSIHAWFKAGADALITWQPVHYDISAYVNIGASVGGIGFSVGADVYIWGPEFSGKARVHISFFFFSISFTITFGAGASTQAKPISWETFEAELLPPVDERLAVNVTEGLIRKLDDSDRVVVNPKDFELTVSSQVPISSIDLLSHYACNSFHIAPISETPEPADAPLAVNIYRDGVAYADDFTLIPETKNYPAAIWGAEFAAGMNGDRTVKDLTSGVRIVPKNQPKVGETHVINRTNLQYETTVRYADNVYEPALQAFQETDTTAAAGMIADVDQLAAQLEALGFDSRTCSLSALEEEDFFVEEPLVVAQS